MQGGPFEVDCSYLVGCDGARSSIRGAAGIEMKGPAALQHLVNIHFFCPGLWHHTSHRPAMLYFVFNSEVVSVLVGHDLPNGELVAQVAAFCLSNAPCCTACGCRINTYGLVLPRMCLFLVSHHHPMDSIMIDSMSHALYPHPRGEWGQRSMALLHLSQMQPGWVACVGCSKALRHFEI